MTIGEFKISRIVIAFAAVLALIVGGYRLYQWRAIDVPIDAALSAIDGVTGYRLSEDPPRTVIVELGEVRDLGSTVRELERVIARYHPGAELKIEDQRDDRLTRAYAAIRFQLEEGLETGRYTAMLTGVRSELNGTGISEQLSIDDRWLYVTLRSGNRYLYEMITRPHQRPGATS